MTRYQNIPNCQRTVLSPQLQTSKTRRTDHLKGEDLRIQWKLLVCATECMNYMATDGTHNSSGDSEERIDFRCRGDCE